jgi:hypothetical protein
MKQMNQPERTMNLEHQRIAIAEACGWKWIQTNHEAKSGLIGTDSPHSGNIPYQGTNYPSNRHLPTYGKAIPDYINCLNAMHEAEKLLYGNLNLPKKYTQQIKNAIRREAGVTKAQMDFAVCITATAAQRAEAFLRTIGKWTTNPNEL